MTMLIDYYKTITYKTIEHMYKFENNDVTKLPIARLKKRRK